MATMTLNSEKNGIEIRFDNKPAQDILEALSKAGFRWSRPQKMWYARQTPGRIDLARRIVGEAQDAGSQNAEQPVAKATTKAKKTAARPAPEMRYTIHGYRDAAKTYTKADYRLCMDQYVGGDHAYEIEVSTDSYGAVPIPKGAEFVNNSDGMTDYFEHSRWFIGPDSPDYLPLLDALEAKEAYEDKLQAKRDAKRYGGNVPSAEEQRESTIRYKMRLMSWSREQAEEATDRDIMVAKKKAERHAAALASARAIAEKLADAHAAQDAAALADARQELEEMVNSYKTQRKAHELETSRKGNLHSVEYAKKRGICTEMNGVALIMDHHTYRVLGKGERQEVFSLLTIDAITGDHLFSGEFSSEDERRAVSAQIINARRHSA